MEWAPYMIGVWLSVLSLVIGRLWLEFRTVSHRLTALHLAEQLTVVTSRIDAQTVARNAALADALAEALRILESDPRLHADNWIEHQRLKRLLHDE